MPCSVRPKFSVNLLPLTPETKGTRPKPSPRMYRGALWVQVGRANRSKPICSLRWKALHVFTTEPLPPRHPFWRHPQHRFFFMPHDAAKSAWKRSGRTNGATAEADTLRAGARRTPSTANAATQRHHGYSSAGLVACGYRRSPDGYPPAASAVPEALAQQLAAQHYGLIAAVHRLDSERGRTSAARAEWPRICREDCQPRGDRAVTNLQTEACFTSYRGPRPAGPAHLPARNGMTELDITFDDGSIRVVRRCRSRGNPDGCAGSVDGAAARSRPAPQRSHGVCLISAIAAPITNCCGTFSTPPNCGH